MANRKSTGNTLITIVCLVAVFVSFKVLLRRVETENILIFSLGISCFLLGYFIKRRHEDTGLSSEIKRTEPISSIQEHKKIPVEFLNEQKRFQNLPPQLKELKK